MKNLGIANVTLKYYDAPPNIFKEAEKHNFDVSAHNWQLYVKSPYISPILLENIIDLDETFSVVYPSKRTYFIDNYVKGGQSVEDAEGQFVTWSQTLEVEDIAAQLKQKAFQDNAYELLTPDKYDSVTDYIGPKWEDSVLEEDPPPDDELTIKEWEKAIEAAAAGGTPDNGNEEEDEVDTKEKIPMHYINQQVPRDGLFWAVESSDFLADNQPFWINFKKMKPPESSALETAIIIRIGKGNDTFKYDLYLSNNKRPILFDYHNKSGKEFETDLSKMFNYNKDLEVGFMTVAGRLVIFVNKMPLVYTRVVKGQGDDAGTFAECKIPSGAVQVSGTNIQCSLNMCPMTYARKGVFAVPIPQLLDEDGEEVDFRGVENDGTLGGSVARLPQDPSISTKLLFGVDCRTFTGDAGDDSPSGTGFHKKGIIGFQRGNTAYAALPSSNFYIVSMLCENMEAGYGESVPYMGCPYFFRLKGGAESEGGAGGDGTTISDIMSVSETATAPDYNHIERTATITIYNPAGKWDSLIYAQKGVSLEWEWSGVPSASYRSFTGVIVNVARSEVAGKETLVLSCKDYIHVLKGVHIINSPFYDGMIMFYACEDLARRAGIRRISNDWDQDTEFALSSGYAFTKPRNRFEGTKTIYDCIMHIVKRPEAYFYFDGNGDMHVARLEGGLFSDISSESATAEFSRNPESDNVIIDGFNYETDYSSTVNVISILTVDRDTRNPIFHTKSSTSGAIAHKKTYLHDQPALGGLDVAIARAEELAERMFGYIYKTTFKCANITTVEPLQFATVDGRYYRVTNVARRYNAESNDMTTEYTAEWLGG